MTKLMEGNRALRNKKYEIAISLYLQTLKVSPDLGKIIISNLAMARRKYRTVRKSCVHQRVAVCGWDLAHNAAERVYTLAKLYQSFAETEIIGSFFSKFGRELSEPLCSTKIPVHSFVVEDEKNFLDQAAQLVADHPYDIIHLSNPRISNIFIGILYKLIWDAKVLVDIDGEELASVKAEPSISIENYLKTNNSLPDLKDLAGKDWTRLAVAVVNGFDGITVANPVLQKLYGGEIIRHARDEQYYHPSLELKRESREKFKIPQDKKVVVFLGTPGEHKGLLETADAIASLNRKDLLLAIVGDVVDPSLKKQLLEKKGVEFLFLGNPPLGSITNFLAIGDYGVLLQDRDSVAAQFETPAKLSDALGMGLVVFSQETPPLADLAVKSAFIPVTSSTLTQVLAKYLKDENLGHKASQSARQIFSSEIPYTANLTRLNSVLIGAAALKTQGCASNQNTLKAVLESCVFAHLLHLNYNALSTAGKGISIIIPTLNAANLLERLLTTFFTVNTYAPVELIIIDNGSTDNTSGMVARFGDRASIRFVECDTNHSFAASCNLGAGMAQYPNLLFLNNDIIYTNDVLPVTAEKLTDPLVGAVGVRLDDDAARLSKGQEPTVQHTGICFVWNEKRQYFQPEQIHYPSLKQYLAEVKDGKTGTDHFSPAVTGAFLLCRKADFVVLGGFSEDYNDGLEDIDFCLRLGTKLWKKCWCLNQMSLQHVEGATRKLWDTKVRIERIEQNHRIFKERWDKYIQGPMSTAAINQPIQELNEKDQDLEEINKIKASKLFDARYYLEKNPDVRTAGMDPITHFCKYGWKEKRQPSEEFNIKYYCTTYPEVNRSGLNPISYYLQYGKKYGHKTNHRLVVARQTDKLSILNEPVVGPMLPQHWKENQIFRALGNIGASSIKDFPKEIKLIFKNTLLDRPQKISVIVPLWNREKQICAAIQSILVQSYKPTEIIVVDDGSSDASCAVLSATYASEIDSGFIHLIKQPHEGVSATRNAGLKAATGDLIAYLDSDNVWRPDYLMVMSAVFAQCDDISTAYAGLNLHDFDNDRHVTRGIVYDRQHLLHSNYIDLNVFMHRRFVYSQNGGFDEGLTRLVDWDLIIRYTQCYAPVFVPYIGVDYYLDTGGLGNISRTVSLEGNMCHVLAKHAVERIRYGLSPLRLAYVLWDWPALSQTFVVNEIKWLVQQGADVIVYYKVEPERAAQIDFEIETHYVQNADHLADLLVTHDRTLCHAHFAYPSTTILAYPACQKAKIPFTFFAHAVDIFHENNRKRNRVSEIVRDPLCLKVFVHGDYHRNFLEEEGVPQDKISYNFQAVDLIPFNKIKPSCDIKNKKLFRGIFIGRFVEKKGIDILIDAAQLLKNEPVVFDLYGYGPLEESCRKKMVEKGIANVNFLGPLNGTDFVVSAIEKTDFLVVPSIVAGNGDREGFPTVIFEAMAASRPVVATSVSAVPNYIRDMVEAILVDPKDPQSLAEGIRRLITMSPQRRSAMISAAKAFLNMNIGTERTLRNYLDVWRQNIVDIFLVTHNTEKYESRKTTFDIIRRVFDYTTTPFVLTIVDNASNPDFRDELLNLCKNRTNVRIVLKNKNILCGPSSNIALSLGNANYAIYLCSKEARIGKHGWERVLIQHMREHPEEAMAGYRTHLPKFTLGSEIVFHPDFHKFRNQKFAIENSEHIFTHVQGGVFILRRSVFEQGEVFSSSIPQGNMDVELSYYLESIGQRLGVVPGVVSLTSKTLPKLEAVVDEHTIVAHPVTINLTDNFFNKRSQPDCAVCNMCGADLATAETDKETCMSCGSIPFGRTIFYRLAHDWRAHRGALFFAFTNDKALGLELGRRMFQVVYSGNDIGEADASIVKSGLAFDVIAIDADLLAISAGSVKNEENLWRSAIKFLKPSGILLFTSGGNMSRSSQNGTLNPISKGLLGAKKEASIFFHIRQSRSLRLDWRGLYEVESQPLLFVNQTEQDISINRL